MASDVVWPRLRSVVLAVTASAKEPGSIAEVKASLCKLLCAVSSNQRNRCHSSCDPFLTHNFINWSYCMHHTCLICCFFQDLSKPVIEESDLSCSDITSGIMQYLLSMIKKQKKMSQVSWFSVEAWMHFFLISRHHIWHIQSTYSLSSTASHACPCLLF